MRISIPKAVAILGAMLLNTQLSSDQAVIPTAPAAGKINLQFDHVFAGNDLLLGQANTTSTGEKVTVSQLKYIISNIILIKDDGTQYSYPKSESYFIIDEKELQSKAIALQDIPAGNYVKIKFGIGVDREQYEMGASGQGDFLAKAQAADLIWSWSAGYKFLAMEGTFTSNSVSTDTPYMIHTGRTGTDYNYCDITLDLPSKAAVGSTATAEVSMVADISKIIDGTHKITLTDHNDMGMGAMIMGGALLPLVTANLNAMFHVQAVKNK